VSIHLRNGLYTACGRQVSGTIRATQDTSAVDCYQCRSTNAYGDRLRADRNLTAPLLNSNLTADQHAIKVVLDQVFESAYREADDQGYCDVFDDIVGDITIPSWYTLPPRKKKWRISARYDSTVDAATEEEALQVIAENPGDYLSVYKDS